VENEVAITEEGIDMDEILVEARANAERNIMSLDQKIILEGKVMAYDLVKIASSPTPNLFRELDRFIERYSDSEFFTSILETVVRKAKEKLEQE
jgi:hypothetical protein